jgi:hypothetical protein
MKLRVLVTIAAAAAMMAAAPQRTKKTVENDPDLREIRDYRLSMDAIQRYVASYKAMMGDAKAQACFKDSPPGNAPTLDKGEKMFNDCAPAVADIKGAGMKPREFLVLTAQLIGDMMAVELKKAGTIKAYPETVSPENAAFLEQNYDKVKALLAPMMNGGGDK